MLPAVATAGAALLIVGVLLARLRPTRLRVEGASMLPLLAAGDRLLGVRWRAPRIGDVVAVRHPRDPRLIVIKRVASISDGALVVLGENRGASTDSRDFGPIPADDVVGIAVLRYAPRGRRRL